GGGAEALGGVARPGRVKFPCSGAQIWVSRAHNEPFPARPTTARAIEEARVSGIGRVRLDQARDRARATNERAHGGVYSSIRREALFEPVARVRIPVLVGDGRRLAMRASHGGRAGPRLGRQGKRWDGPTPTREAVVRQP